MISRSASPVELLQNKRCLRYIQAQHSELFHVFARRLSYALVSESLAPRPLTAFVVFRE